MDDIYNLLPSDCKEIVKFEDSFHNDTVLQESYWDTIHTFIKDKVNPVGLWKSIEKLYITIKKENTRHIINPVDFISLNSFTKQFEPLHL